MSTRAKKTKKGSLGLPPYERFQPRGKQRRGNITAKSRIERSKALHSVATDSSQSKETKKWAYQQAQLESARAKTQFAQGEVSKIIDKSKGKITESDTANLRANLHNIEVDLNPMMIGGKDENGNYNKSTMKYRKTK